MRGADVSVSRNLAEIERRLEALVRSWPQPLATEFRAYRHARCGDGWIERAGSTSGVDGSYWLLLPGALHQKHTGASGRDPGTLLGDSLWAQYCVFLAVRTDDDLRDGQTRLRGVAEAVERLHLQAARVLEPHLPAGSAFWSYLDGAVQKTESAIAEVDRLQRSADGMPADSLTRYAEVGEIFKIGSAAVCMALEGTEDLASVGRCCDRLAIASQLLDDLVDLGEDLQQGRRNFAASWMLRFGLHRGPPGALPDGAIWRTLVRTEAAEQLLERTRLELRRASRAIAAADLPVAGALIDLLLQEVDLFEDRLHRARVELVFRGRPLSTPSSRRTG